MLIACTEGAHLSEGERAVIDFLNENQSLIGELSLADIARRTFVSGATASRAIRKCGFASFSEMKYRLKGDTSGQRASCEVNQILSKSYRECLQTLQSIDIGAVLRTVELLRGARRVLVIANGMTAMVAKEFSTYLQYQCIGAWCISDTNVMRTLDKVIGRGDLLVVISVKNTLPELEIAAGLARKQGASVAVLCCRKGTGLDRYADVAVYGATSLLAPQLAVDTTSRLGLSIMIRTIVEYMNNNQEGSL